MVEYLNIGKGEILLNDFINIDIALDDQIWSLKEDMLQISYFNKFLIDIGWTNEFELDGKFRIMIIENEIWDNPIKIKQTSNVKELVRITNDFILYIEKMYIQI